MLIALAMSEFDVSVILPQQAFYMLSADPWKLADDRMLAMIVSLFGHAISLKEQERRHAKDAVVFAPFDAEAAIGNSKTRVAFLLFDGAYKSPTHDLVYGTVMDFLKDCRYETFLVARTFLTRAQLDEGEVFPYDQSCPSVVSLKEAFGGALIYICSDDTDEYIVAKLRELRGPS